MRKKRTMEQRLRALINAEAKRGGARRDFLTLEQWLETLEYFNNKCAYCGGPFEVLEHYLAEAGTTVSNCVPACFSCNVMIDKYGHDLSFYQNKNVIRFIGSKGVNISFHIHKYEALKKDYVVLYCEGCGESLDVPGLSINEAQAYLDQFFVNTGYAYIS